MVMMLKSCLFLLPSQAIPFHVSFHDACGRGVPYAHDAHVHDGARVRGDVHARGGARHYGARNISFSLLFENTPCGVCGHDAPYDGVLRCGGDECARALIQS